MNVRAEDISSMVFKANVQADMGEIPLDGRMLLVLLELDGKRSTAQIARALGMNAATIKAVLSRLMGFHLVQAGDQSVPMLGKDFFAFLRDQLSIVAGPIAQLMVEDAVSEIGRGASGIPKTRAAEFIDLIARQIPDEAQRLSFIRVMMKKIKEI